MAVSFLVAAKFSFARLRRNPIEDIAVNDSDKKLLSKLFEKASIYLHSLQFIIVTLLIATGYILYPLADLFGQLLKDWMNLHDTYALVIGHIIFIIIISVLMFVFAETIPKAIALSSPEKTFLRTSRYAVQLSYLVKPLVIVLIFIARSCLAPFKIKVLTEIDLVHSEEEIRTLVNHSHQSGAIDKVERELIDNVFDFVDRMAKEVMVPRQEVVCLYAEESFEENRKTIMESKHTRYPLCLDDKDHIVGLIHVKDIMENEAIAKKDLRNIKRRILIIPEVMKLSVLLQHMRVQRTYQSVVVDEYGGMVGLVGLEDIVEELVGDIRDENEEPMQQIVNLGEGRYDFDGMTLIGDVEETLKIELSDAEEDTLGGYIFGLLGHTPKINDIVVHNNFSFKVRKLEGYRVARVEAAPIRETFTEGGEVMDEHI